MTRDWNSLPDATPDATACPDCGAPIPGGRRACRELYHETNQRLQADTWPRLSETRTARSTGSGQASLGETRPHAAAAPMRSIRLLVNSYALQHLDPYCRTAKELIYHIASLCCGLEFGGSPAIYAALHRSIEGQVHANRPTPPRNLGDLTILSVASAFDNAKRLERIESWAGSVWVAYCDLHGVGRNWIKRATA
jgi:hypothetical protein